jgi:hypothetical protein
MLSIFLMENRQQATSQSFLQKRAPLVHHYMLYVSELITGSDDLREKKESEEKNVVVIKPKAEDYFAASTTTQPTTIRAFGEARFASWPFTSSTIGDLGFSALLDEQRKLHHQTGLLCSIFMVSGSHLTPSYFSRILGMKR